MVITKEIPKSYRERYLGYFDLDKLRILHGETKKGYLMLYGEAHPVVFAYFCLGKKLRMYQAYAVDMILENPKVALCWARRLGKSTIIGVISLWCCYYNKYPKNAIERFTEIGILSKDDDASKKILDAIRSLVYDGDLFWLKVTGEREKFSKSLCEPNNSTCITWLNNSKVKSFPPTEKIRGNGFSILFEDEIGYLNHSDPHSYHITACMPTLADTRGKSVISSTPNGQEPNIFYFLFDIDGKFDTDYLGIFYTWDVNGDDDKYRTYVMEQKENLRKQGKIKFYEQEYECSFTVTADSFFDNKHVDAYFKDYLVAEYEWHKSDCSMGLDFGISNCLTVMTIKTRYRGKVRTLLQYAFPSGYDINHLLDAGSDDAIPRMMERYNIKWIIADQCPQGDSLIKKMISLGYPVIGEDFKGLGKEDTVKTQRYYQYRSMLSSGIMECYPIPELRVEMLGLREELKVRFYCIRKSSGGYDDRIDSDLYATVPYFDNDITNFQSDVIDYGAMVNTGKTYNGKKDLQWEQLVASDTSMIRK